MYVIPKLQNVKKNLVVSDSHYDVKADELEKSDESRMMVTRVIVVLNQLKFALANILPLK